MGHNGDMLLYRGAHDLKATVIERLADMGLRNGTIRRLAVPELTTRMRHDGLL